MPEHQVEYSIDGQPFHYVVKGSLAGQSERCLLKEDDDLTVGCDWNRRGYVVAKPWNNDVSEILKASVHTLFDDVFQELLGRPLTGDLQHYHTYLDDAEHLQVVLKLRDLPTMADRVVPVARLEEGLSQVMGVPVACYNPKLGRFGCSIRIIRPLRNDHNPLHKDVWLDRLRHAVNLYIPVAGSNEQSSLSLIPESHYWKESEIRRTEGSCEVNGVEYTVPSVVKSVHGLKMVRPKLTDNEILIFSPYLIHGGARNLNQDITRISLEMRFWRKD